MGKHWNRRDGSKRSFGGRASRGANRAVAAAEMGRARDPRDVERHVASGCASKRAYATLQQAADAKAHYDAAYGGASHVYRCRYCGRYHLSRSDAPGRGAVADRYLPPPTHGGAKRGFPEALADVMARSGTDAAALARAVGAEPAEVRAWLAGDPRGAFRAPEVARALGIPLSDLI